MSNEVLEIFQSLKSFEDESIAQLVGELSMMVRNQSYKNAGYPSVFTFMTKALGYSGGAAYRRIQAAGCVSANPEIYEKIRNGKISLSALAEIARGDGDSVLPLSLSER